MLTCDFTKTGLHHGYFSRNVPTFSTIFICLVSQEIIIVLRGPQYYNYNFLIKSSGLTKNEKELNNVGDTELNFLAIKFISKNLHTQKQWKSKTSNMLQVSKNVIITSKTWGPGAWDGGPGAK